MMAKKKYKPMTRREKEEMKQFRKDMREKGVLPPVKKRLNRNKYIEDTIQMWNNPDDIDSRVYLTMAFGFMMGRIDQSGHVHPEAIGAAKVLRLAIKLKEFSAMLRAEGKDSYTQGEMYEYLKETLEE